MFQGLGTQVLSCCCWQGPDEASGSHWRLGKTELLGFSFVLGSAHPLRPNSQPSLYGGRETGKSTDTQKSWDKPMTECERVQVDANQQFGEKPSIPDACKQRQIRA